MKHRHLKLPLVTLLLGVALTPSASAQPYKGKTADPACPGFGWSEIFMSFTLPNAQFPTNDTATLPTADCSFHEWSWEAFAWAVTPVNGQPRFLGLQTMEDLLPAQGRPRTGRPRALKLGLRPHRATQPPEGASAIVEADGNMLVAPNGYPVYASVHMNPSYFATAQANLIINGGYTNQNPTNYFSVGAGVFKATWLRVDNASQIPAGAYSTTAIVPVLAQTISTNRTATNTTLTYTIGPLVSNGVTVTTTATVALVGLHVVGYTVNHPEFLWGTFEHNLNSPATPDNTFTTNGVSTNNYTFYRANTSYAAVNLANNPPTLQFNPTTQKFLPTVNVVQQNRTGGENQSNGVSNILSLNASAQKSLAYSTNAPLRTFANYHLVGTVWMFPNTYLTNPVAAAQSAVGSVTLANTTAETFIQSTVNQPLTNVNNCFTCHNYTSYSFFPPPGFPALANRAIALSHALSVGTAYAVSNNISGSVTVPVRPLPPKRKK